ncbi:NADPH-dependent FMN reductase [Actinocorallia populi]|uniref:NADPH-dependent FMN reductase n=1 Tax=Actinocorallia populi TaxID=2079200 RepID=UPI000D09314A|nr:NAD(P)H-dependent oxidoreductase [Actinocorallia populi]
MSLPRLQVIVGSTRPGRAGGPVAEWFAGYARDHGGFEVEVVDLAELDLPMYDEPNHPATGNYVNEHTRRWSALASRAQAYVMVTPEYNNGYPAVLKNAIDYLNREWRYKPVGFVSYGGVSAGTRAVGQLRQVLTTVKMFPIPDAVHIPFVGQSIRDGRFEAGEAAVGGAKAMLDELLLIVDRLIPLQLPAAGGENR